MAFEIIKAYLEEYLSGIIFLVGIVLLFIGLLFLKATGSVLSATSFFLGITFIAFGIFIKVGFFSMKLRSLDGFGTILVCSSVLLFALAIALIQFLEIRVVGFTQEVFRGVPLPYFRVHIESERPYAYMVDILIKASVIQFLTGLIIKIYYALRR
jgi:hypothetical protein